MRIRLDTLRQDLRRFIWETPLENLPRWQRGLINALRIAILVVRDLAEGQLTMQAMGLVYTTLLSLVPLLAVSFSVLKGFGVHNQVRPMLLKLMEPLGEKGIEITDQIITFVDNIRVGVLGAVGLALLFYTVISLLQKIERAFNYTWRVAKIRPLSQRFSDYLSVILVGPVLMFTAIGLTASFTSTAFVQALLAHPLLGGVIDLVAHLLPYGLLTIVFSFVYVLFPNTRVRLSAALIGGVVAAILWQLTGWLFAAFVVNSAKYTAIYSVFATLIIFLIWLYLNWLILLVGCSIAFYVQHGEYRNLRPRFVRLSNRVRERLGLQVMARVGRRFCDQQPGPTVAELAAELNVGADICERIVEALQEVALIIPTADEPPRLLPGAALESLTLESILVRIRSTGERDSISPAVLPPDPPVDAVVADIESAIARALGQRTLADLVCRAGNAADTDQGRQSVA